MEKNVEHEVDTQNRNEMSTHPTVFQDLNRNAQIPSPTKSEPQNPKPRNPKPQNPDPNRAKPLLRQMATFTITLRSARTRCGGKNPRARVSVLNTSVPKIVPRYYGLGYITPNSGESLGGRLSSWIHRQKEGVSIYYTRFHFVCHYTYI